MTVHPDLRATGKVSFFLVLFFGILTGCNNNLIYDEQQEISGQSWHKDSLLVFEPVVKDTSRVLNIGFTMEHNSDYPYSNLWLFIDVKSPGGRQQTDTMEFFLAEPDGTWVGKGNDNTRTLYWMYKGGVKLSEPGQYHFEVQQGMRRDNLQGVNSLSLWVEEAQEEESE